MGFSQLIIKDIQTKNEVNKFYERAKQQGTTTKFEGRKAEVRFVGEDEYRPILGIQTGEGGGSGNTILAQGKEAIKPKPPLIEGGKGNKIYGEKTNKLGELEGTPQGQGLGGLNRPGKVGNIPTDSQPDITGIVKGQDAVGDLGKYAKGEDENIFITKKDIASLQPLSGGGLGSGKEAFKSWEEAVA